MATAERLVDLYQRLGGSLDPVLRDRVIGAWMDAQAYRLYTYQTAAKMMAGGSIGAESSLNKLFWSEMDVRTHETALALLGALAELDGGAPADPVVERRKAVAALKDSDLAALHSEGRGRDQTVVPATDDHHVVIAHGAVLPRIASAASIPGAPMTPPPGCAPDAQSQRFLTGVR